MTEPSAVTTMLTSAPLWAMEHEIVIRYFSSAERTIDTDKRWVGHQMFKEWTGSGIYGPKSTTVATIIAEVAAEIASLDQGGVAPAPLRSTHAKLSFASDELGHYAQLHDLYLLMDSEAPPPAISELGSLSHGLALTELRLRWRDDPIGEVAVDLSEGGGLGLFFGIRSSEPLLNTESAIDQEILQVANKTIGDESQHLLGRFRDARSRGLLAEDWAKVQETLYEICYQRVLERNEQFGNPLSEVEIEEARENPDANRTKDFLQAHLSFLLDELGVSL